MRYLPRNWVKILALFVISAASYLPYQAYKCWRYLTDTNRQSVYDCVGARNPDEMIRHIKKLWRIKYGTLIPRRRKTAESCVRYLVKERRKPNMHAERGYFVGRVPIRRWPVEIDDF